MAKAIDFAVRTSTGTIVRGAVAGEGGSEFMQVGSGESVSLNVSQSSVAGYERQGSDLVIRLADGRAVVLSGYFESAPGQDNKLYLSSNGEIVEVYLTDGGNGTMYANYGPADTWNKYSTLDDLRFTDQNVVAGVVADDDPAGMAAFVPGLLGLGGAGTAAAIAGGVAVIGGGLGGGGGGGPTRTPPAVNQPDSSNTLTTNTEAPKVMVSGTGEKGDTVKVVVGDKTVETTIKDDGTWEVTIPGTDLPADGTHEAVVTVTGPNFGPVVLDGPTFVIDMTPPAVSVTEGSEASGHVENAVDYEDGVKIGGQGEAGATVAVKIGEFTQTTTITADGTWTVTFPKTEIEPGEYKATMTVTATDALGNKNVITEYLVVDTVANTISFDAVTPDNIVNAAEAGGIVTVTGMATANATLTITMGTTVQTATAGADGKWSVTYPAGTFSTGDGDRTITAKSVDAAGNTFTTTHVVQVDTVTSVSFSSGAVAGDNIINGTEAAGGVTLTGQAEAGATSVRVEWNGTTLPATVAANGSWTVSFPASAIPTANGSVTATVTATDLAGNTATDTKTVAIDRATSVTVDPNQTGGDNIVSGVEAGNGITLTGTAESGASVEVTFQGTTRTVTAGTDGKWSANFASSEISGGTKAETVSVKSTDLAGNTATATHALKIDTEVTDFARQTLSTGSDDILNKVEAANGLTVTGTVEPGSTVSLTFNGSTTVNATVGADGKWSALVPAGAIPAGENSFPMVVNATDAVGNTAQITENVKVDTLVTNFARLGGTISGDGMLNNAEVKAGLDLNGTSEVGSTVVVSLSNGSSETVTVGADGKWAVRFEANELPTGQGGAPLDVKVSATDIAGNVASFTEQVIVDTVAPGSPDVKSFSRDAAGLRGIGTETTDDTYSFTRIDPAGNETQINAIQSDDTVFNESNFRFSSTVPDGSYLVINTEDTAGNSSSTLLIVDNSTATSVDLGRAGLSGFDFAAIDLTFAPDASMTISADQLVALTGPENKLVVKGDADDHVTLQNAVKTTGTEVIDGQTYDVYTLGNNGARILLDDDIQSTI